MKLVLILMIKNESKIIKRCLESVKEVVDAFCILDTGSTDNTVELVNEFLTTNTGCLTVEPWKDFGYNRTVSFQNAQKYVRDTLQWDLTTTYGLLLDADMIFNAGKLREQTLDKIGYQIIQINGRLEYSNIRIIRLDFNWKCIGPTHEYWHGPSETVLSKDICYIDDRNDGGCKQDKFQRDCRLLLDAVESDPTNARHVFYLAQTYKDTGQLEEAVKWYKKRYEMGGWVEEQYISAYNIAKITHDKEWVWKAHECNPKRIECLVSYLTYCRTIGKFSQELFAMALYCSSVKKPTDQRLFLEPDVYDWKVWDELSLIAYYTGHRDLAKMMFEKLISDNKAPSTEMERIKKNYQFTL